MDPQHLLERMASISPGVRLHITGRLWLENIDEDEIDHQKLTNECFAVMIGEAHEIGIEFYCTMGDLCESFYVMDQTLLLFEVVFPTPLYRSITENDAFKNMISSVVLDVMSVEGETTIETILENLALYNEKTSSVFINTYNFLKDKMKSTPVFDAYVTSTLNIDDTPFSVMVNDKTINNYLEYTQNRFTKLLQVADVLFSKLDNKDDLATLYDVIDQYKIKATDQSTLEIYSWAYEARNEENPLPEIQMYIEKYRIQFCASIPLCEEYYILRGVPVERTDVVGLVVRQYLETNTKEAFLDNVTNTFNRLQANGKVVVNDITTLVQQLSLIIVQEYYK